MTSKKSGEHPAIQALDVALEEMHRHAQSDEVEARKLGRVNDQLRNDPSKIDEAMRSTARRYAHDIREVMHALGFVTSPIGERLQAEGTELVRLLRTVAAGDPDRPKLIERAADFRLRALDELGRVINTEEYKP